MIQGITETFECVDPIVGQYVSVVRSGVEAVLSLCEVEVFSSSGLSIASCTEAANPDQLAVFDNSCFHFLNEEIAGKPQKIVKSLNASFQFDDIHLDMISYEICDLVNFTKFLNKFRNVNNICVQ